MGRAAGGGNYFFSFQEGAKPKFGTSENGDISCKSELRNQEPPVDVYDNRNLHIVL